MRHLKICTGLFFIILLMNCANEHKTSSAGPNGESPNLFNTENGINAKDSLDRTGNKIDSLDNDDRFTKMIADLNFKTDEINEYRSLARIERNNWSKANATAVVGIQERLRMEDDIMKKLLSQNRYNQYQEWLKDNPLKK